MPLEYDSDKVVLEHDSDEAPELVRAKDKDAPYDVDEAYLRALEKEQKWIEENVRP